MHRRLLRRPFVLGEVLLDDVLPPCAAVVGTHERSPGVAQVLAVGSGEPERHETYPRNLENVGDLHRQRRELWSGYLLERRSVLAAVELMMRRSAAPASHPQKHRAVPVQPFPDRDFAVFRRRGNCNFFAPCLAAVIGKTRKNVAFALVDRMGASPAVRTNEPTAKRLNHLPGIVAGNILYNSHVILLGCHLRGIRRHQRSKHKHRRNSRQSAFHQIRLRS